MAGFTFEGRTFVSRFGAQVAVCVDWLEDVKRTGRKVDGVDPFDAPAAVDAMFDEAIEAHVIVDGDTDHRLMRFAQWVDDWDHCMRFAHQAIEAVPLLERAMRAIARLDATDTKGA